MPGPSSPIRHVPVKTPMFDGPMFQQGTSGTSQAGNLTRQWLLFFEGIPTVFEATDKITFGIGIGAVQPVGDDLTNHGVCNSDGTLLVAEANAKIPPSALPLYLDIEISHDQGDTWTSIFLTGGTADANKLVIPVGDSRLHTQAVFSQTPFPVGVGDFWRINLLTGSGADAQAIEVVLVWGVPSVDQSIQDLEILAEG